MTESSGKKYCITGGCGYLGYHIGRTLLSQSSTTSVVLFDRSRPNDLWKDDDKPDVLAGFTFIQGNILAVQDLESAFTGIDCVIHTAAFGLSNRDQLPEFWNEVEAINVGGTKNVIEACCQQNVSALVYTSTNNVVFDGRQIVGGDESLPYVPTFKHSDHYSRTKTIAEQMVLLVNGKCLSDGEGHLRTCALRLGGLIGPGEQRHIRRIMDGYRDGIVVANFWYNDGLSDFVMIHNAVDAHIKAAEALMDNDRKNTVAGQAYFISDGQPINIFKYFSSMARELGYKTPKRRIPPGIIWMFEMIPCHLLIALNIPTLTRTEFLKTVVTNYFSIDKARRELGYCPTRPNDYSKIVEWFKQNESDRDGSSSPEKCHKINARNQCLKFLSILLLLLAFVVAFLLI